MYIPPLTKKLLWAVLAIALLPLLLPDALRAQLMLWPFGEDVIVTDPAGGLLALGFRPWQLVTHLVVGNGFGQILFLGLTLAFFGAPLEANWGERRYGLYLLACAAGGGLLLALALTAAVQLGWMPKVPAAGPSAVIFGILFAMAYLNPRQRVMLLIPPIPMEMRVLVAVLAGLELLIGVFGSAHGIAHLGFLGGMLAGWLHIQYWRGEPPFRRRGPRLVR